MNSIVGEWKCIDQGYDFVYWKFRDDLTFETNELERDRTTRGKYGFGGGYLTLLGDAGGSTLLGASVSGDMLTITPPSGSNHYYKRAW